MKIKVKTSFNGQVAVIEHKVKTALEKKCNLSFIKGNEIMDISNSELIKMLEYGQVQISNNTYTNKWTGKEYKLYFFFWKPNRRVPEQSCLF